MHDLTNFTNGLYINNETVFDKNIAKKNFDYFYNSFKDIHCKAFVISKTKDNRCKKRDPFFKPYITSGIAKSCKVKNELHNRWIRVRGTQYE